MRILDSAILTAVNIDTDVFRLTGARHDAIWVNLAPEATPFPRVLISRLSATDEYLAGRVPERARFVVATYHVEAIDSGPNPGVANAIEAVLARCLDDAPLFGQNGFGIDLDTGDTYHLLDCRVTDRIQRSEIVQRPRGARLWYRGVVLRIDLQVQQSAA